MHAVTSQLSLRWHLESGTLALLQVPLSPSLLPPSPGEITKQCVLSARACLGCVKSNLHNHMAQYHMNNHRRGQRVKQGGDTDDVRGESEEDKGWPLQNREE